MVWARITLDKKTPLVFVHRSVKINAEVYQEKILRDVLLPWVAENFVSGQCVLQQDCAPAHPARSTLALCESHFPGYWTKDFWPPYSPDLNPMDFAVWGGYLKQKVSSKSHQSLSALKAPLQKAWDDIDVTFLRPTVMSVEKKLKACIAAEGAHFEHLSSE
ncbi:unnamed protein product [Heligmosomoides polygyrus]|uniref:DDE_3 domain-containing protein n=1 Tax=Heligmosomoides polygyrus TaxID=6339 RepID=A0A183GA70_HELPZ|nr:unnamed protein product [Heligmosomoides polygyrus]